MQPRSTSTASKGQRGFTLVEMMVVVAIIAILAVIGVAGISKRAYSATAKNISEQLVSTMAYARLRAGATRKIHRVQIQPQQVSIWALSTTGLTIPTTPSWGLVSNTTIPNGLVVWHAQAGANVSPGANPTQSTTLTYAIDFRPDGQATASTVFVTDSQQRDKYRVLVYHATGGSYARQSW